MANPLSNEDELYERIKQEKIEIHPIIWELLTHHIGNDLSMITMGLQTSLLDPEYPKPLTKEKAQKMFDGALNIKGLIEKLKKATGREDRF